MTNHEDAIRTHDPVQFDPRHPRHWDGTRESNLLAGIIVLIGLIGYWAGALDILPDTLAVSLILLVAGGAWLAGRAYFARGAIRARGRADTEYRANIEAETKRKLAEMRANEQQEPRP